MVKAMETSTETKAGMPIALPTDHAGSTILYLAYSVVAIVLAYTFFHIVY